MTAVPLEPGQCTCVVRSFREGLLSAMGHDLVLDAPPTAVTVDPEARVVEARFDPRAVTVRAAVVHGHEDPGALSANDRSKILGNLVDTVLTARAHPAVTFRGQWKDEPEGELSVAGDLTLRGVTRPVRGAVRRVGERLVAEFVLRPSQWGIVPFVALLGALRVRDEVRVEVSLPTRVATL